MTVATYPGFRHDCRAADLRCCPQLSIDLAALRFAFQRGRLHLSGELAPLTHPKFFAAWLRPLFRKDWIVYSKPSFGGPEYGLQYLGRYTHRVAIGAASGSK